MIRFLEENGYDVSYVSGLDTRLDASLLPKHKVFLSVGHDEYWSKDQRDNVDGGPRRRREPRVLRRQRRLLEDSLGTDAGRSRAREPDPGLLQGHVGEQPDRSSRPTSTWRDPRFGDLGHGPENSLIGTLYKANSVDLAIKVDCRRKGSCGCGGTPLALARPAVAPPLCAHTIGYESDEDVDNGFRPAGLIRMSTTTGPTPEYLTDFGNTVVPGTTTHHLTMYKAPAARSCSRPERIQWWWGLDANHDGDSVQPADPRMQQATVNILADMSAASHDPGFRPDGGDQVHRHDRADVNHHPADLGIVDRSRATSSP